MYMAQVAEVRPYSHPALPSTDSKTRQQDNRGSMTRPYETCIRFAYSVVSGDKFIIVYLSWL